MVLFIHGILGSQRQRAHLVDTMNDDHRVLLPDLFGHGESAKPLGDYSLSAHTAAMRDLLDHLEIERVTPGMGEVLVLEQVETPHPDPRRGRPDRSSLRAEAAYDDTVGPPGSSPR